MQTLGRNIRSIPKAGLRKTQSDRALWALVMHRPGHKSGQKEEKKKMKFKIHVPNITDREIIGSPEEAVETFEESLWEAQLLPDDECLTTADMGLTGGVYLEDVLEAQGFLTYGEAYVEVIRERV